MTKDCNQFEFEQLLRQLTEGNLAPPELQRLGELLESSFAFRQHYLDYCQMHALLRTEHGLLTSWSPVAELSADAAHGPKRKWSVAKILFAFSTAAALLIAAGGYYLAYLADNGPPSPHRGSETAKLTRAVGAKFAYGSSGEAVPKEGAPLRQGRYELLSGLVEMEYDSGAVLLVRAPAAFDLVDNTSVRLEDGQLAAHVPPAAKGFRIESPGATVIDLGTDFAVQAIKEKESEVHVFKGEVLLDLHGDKDKTADLLKLVTGEAARVDYVTGMPSGIDLDELQFLRSLRDESNLYAQIVLAMNPAVYYRMEPSGDGTQLFDSAESGAHATIHVGRTTAPVWTAGKVGAALTLGGPAQQCYASALEYPQTSGDEITVAGWVYAHSRPRWASIAKNWAGGVGDRGQFHFGLYEDSGELEAHVVDSSGKEIIVRDKGAFPLHTWYHVALVADGKMLRLYRDGVEVDARPYEKLHRDERIRALGIGTKLNLAGTAPEERDFNMWDGRLDELAIFNHALSPDEIRTLSEL
jgi:hypothetical protein